MAQKDVTLASTSDAVSVNKAVTSVTGNISATANKFLTIGADVLAQKDVTLSSTNDAVSVNSAVTSVTGNVSATDCGQVSDNWCRHISPEGRNVAEQECECESG